LLDSVPDSELLAVVLKDREDEHARLRQVHALMARGLPGLSTSDASRTLPLFFWRLILFGFLGRRIYTCQRIVSVPAIEASAAHLGQELQRLNDALECRLVRGILVLWRRT
jgi:hypothetical protein